MIPYFHARDGLFFRRLEKGDVRITKTQGLLPDDPAAVIELDVLVPGVMWVSAVLAMSKFGERPGDWVPLIQHHDGLKDLFAK